MLPVTPTGINVHRADRKVTIEWNDGHTSRYSFSLLRYACPCATCSGGHENMRSEPDPKVFSRPETDTAETRLKNMESVGTYALTIQWEDGHHYGIYTWHYLRALCPCPECNSRFQRFA